MFEQINNRLSQKGNNRTVLTSFWHY